MTRHSATIAHKMSRQEDPIKACLVVGIHILKEQGICMIENNHVTETALPISIKREREKDRQIDRESETETER